MGVFRNDCLYIVQFPHLVDHNYTKRLCLTFPSFSLPPKPMNLNINSLNDDCFRLIFVRLPLWQQITLRLVCAKWKSILSEMLRPKMSLKLFANFSGIEAYCELLKRKGLTKDDDFRLKTVAEGDDDLMVNVQSYFSDFLEFIHSLLPNIRKFVICYYCADQNFRNLNLALLLKEWPLMTSLVIINFPLSPLFEWEMWKLLSLRFTSLKHLHLLEASNFDLIPLDVISRLERFTVLHYHGPSPLLGGSDTTHLRLGDIFCTPISLTDSLNWKPNFGHSLTHLTIDSVLFGALGRAEKLAMENYCYVFLTICTHFPAITHLDLVAPCSKLIPMSKILSGLSYFPRLTSLNLSTVLHGLKLCSDDIIKFRKPLSTIQHLQLSISGKHCPKHQQQSYCEWLAAFFPCLTELVIKCEDILNMAKFKSCFDGFREDQLHLAVICANDEVLVDRTKFMGRHYERFLENILWNTIKNMPNT